MLQKIKLYGTYFSTAVSTGLLLIPLQYIIRYLIDTGNPLRQEYLIGVMLGSFISLFAWSVTALLAYTSRNLLSKRALHILYAPSVTLASLLEAISKTPCTFYQALVQLIYDT
jgi:hypothetical protein